jgi:uncharacterized protein (TIGR03083 family)
MITIDDSTAVAEYRAARERMVRMVAGMGHDAVGGMVAACPAWTVKDLFAHVTGIAVDLSQGNRPQGDPQAWVDRQVAERAGASLEQVIDEWNVASVDFEAMIEARPDRLWGLTYDLVVHEHDLRTALGDRNARDTSGVTLAARLGLRLLAMDLDSRQLPGVRVVIDGEGFDVGERESVATLTTTAFEALRVLGSRRTLEEVRAAGFVGDLDAVLPGLLHMDPPAVSLGE